MSSNGRILIYGGRGALGSKCVSHFKANRYWVGSIDHRENAEADLNIIVDKTQSPEEQEKTVLESTGVVLDGCKLDGIFCVAGGWIGGSASKDLVKNSDTMWNSSVISSLISTSLAVKHLNEGGILQLAGAKAALEGTPNMIGYGLAKNAVHYLTKCLANPNSGLPKNATVVSILPSTLDTPLNRKWMPNGDFTTWTPLEFVAEMFLSWVRGQNKPTSGSLLQLVTINCNTDIIPVIKY